MQGDDPGTVFPLFFGVKPIQENRPNEFQHPRGVESGIEKSYLLEGKTTVPKNNRHGVTEEAVWNSLRKIKASNEDEF